MKLIAISAPGNHGKTTTIRAFFELLTSNDVGGVQIIRVTRGGEPYVDEIEYRAVVSYKGKIVGISTIGDNWTDVTASIDFFLENNCDIAVFTTRSSKAGASKWVSDFVEENSHSLIRMNPVQVLESQNNPKNELQIKEEYIIPHYRRMLLDMVDNFITGTL